MTATRRDVSPFPSNWSRTCKLHREKIARRLAENGSRAIKLDLESIKARRERLRALTRNMKRPLVESYHSAPSSSYSRANIRLTPIRSRSPNQLDIKQKEDTLLQTRKLPSMFSFHPNRPSSDCGCYQSDMESNMQHRATSRTVGCTEERKEGRNATKTDPDILRESQRKVEEIIEQLRSSCINDRLKGLAHIEDQFASQDFQFIDLYIQEGGIASFVDCLSHNDPTLQLQAANTFTVLISEQTEHADAILESGMIAQLISLLSSEDERIVLQSIEALSNMASDSLFVCQNIVDEGAVPAFFKLIEKEHSLECLQKLSRTFRIMSKHKSLSPPYDDSKRIIEAVKIFTHHPDEEIHLNGCWSFADLTESSKSKIDEVLRCEILPYLITEFLSSNDESKVSPAVKTVGNIMAETDEQTEIVVSAGVIPVLVKQLGHKSWKVRKDCAWALSNVTGGTCSQIQKVIDNNALPQLARIINEDEDLVRREAIWCVSNLAEIGTAEQIDEIINCDLLRSFVRNIRRYIQPFDKVLLYNSLNGVRNMVKFCHDDVAVTMILQEISIGEIGRLAEYEDTDISEMAKLLHDFLSCEGEEKDEQYGNSEEANEGREHTQENLFEQSAKQNEESLQRRKSKEDMRVNNSAMKVKENLPHNDTRGERNECLVKEAKSDDCNQQDVTQQQEQQQKSTLQQSTTKSWNDDENHEEHHSEKKSSVGQLEMNPELSHDNYKELDTQETKIQNPNKDKIHNTGNNQDIEGQEKTQDLIIS